jgi:hypothetical protein
MAFIVLSLKDKYYGTDENYWRDPVWVPITYMALQRLLVSEPCLRLPFLGQRAP